MICYTGDAGAGWSVEACGGGVVVRGHPCRRGDPGQGETVALVAAR